MEKEDATLAADIEAIAETRRLRSRISIVQESIERRKKEYAELTRPTAQAAEAMGA